MSNSVAAALENSTEQPQMMSSQGGAPPTWNQAAGAPQVPQQPVNTLPQVPYSTVSPMCYTNSHLCLITNFSARIRAPRPSDDVIPRRGSTNLEPSCRCPSGPAGKYPSASAIFHCKSRVLFERASLFIHQFFRPHPSPPPRFKLPLTRRSLFNPKLPLPLFHLKPSNKP